MSEGMELQVWGGDWGLPSVDVRSLQMMTYAKLCGAPVKIRATNNPLRSPTGRLPVFTHRKKVISSFTDLVAYLREQNFSTDLSLTNEQKAEVIAYIHLLEEKLWPAIAFVWWVEERNYTELSRPWYAKALPFPLNYYYPGHFQREGNALLESLFPNVDSPQEMETMVLRNAEKCLTLLSWKLDSRNNFSLAGNSSLDAYILGLLAPLLKAPFPTNALSNYARACSNLAEFSRLMLRRHFPSSATDASIHPGVVLGPAKKESEENDFPNKYLNRFLAVSFAVVATLGYASASGILPLDWGSDVSRRAELHRRARHKKLVDVAFGEEHN